jgi:hypothetical protein
MLTCAHCGLNLRSSGVHDNGPQAGKNTCAILPYGYLGHAAGTPCPAYCLGAD